MVTIHRAHHSHYLVVLGTAQGAPLAHAGVVGLVFAVRKGGVARGTKAAVALRLADGTHEFRPRRPRHALLPALSANVADVFAPSHLERSKVRGVLVKHCGDERTA